MAGEAVDVEASRTELGNGNVLGNTSGGSTIPLVRRLNFLSGRSYVTGAGRAGYRTYVIAEPWSSRAAAPWARVRPK